MKIDHAGFEAAVQRHHAAVYRSARRIVRCDEDAADVMQQVFAQVWRGRLGLGGAAVDVERRLRWLASKFALNCLRSDRRRRQRKQEKATMTDAIDPMHAPRLAGDERELVRASIEHLDADHRATVVLRCHEDLTLAAIGAAMGCAESTVHARLQAALAILRRRLRECGFAAAAGRVEGIVGEVGRLPMAVPPGLGKQLLAIPTAIGGLALGNVAIAAGLVVGLCAATLAAHAVAAPTGPWAAPAVAVASAPGHETGALQQEPAGRSLVGGARPAPESAAARAAAVAAAPTARVVGTIAATSGEPLVDVEVTANCAQLSRKAEPFEVTAVTNAQGAYELVLPILDPAGADYRLRLRRADWSGTFAAPDLHLLANEQRRRVDATMQRWAGDAPGDWVTDAVVTDGAGRPVAKAAVLVFRRMLDANGADQLVQEVRAETDAGGRAALAGDHRGDKVVRVVAFDQPFEQRELRMALTGATPPEIVVALGPDTPLAVRIIDGRSGEPLRGVVVHAERDGRTLAVGVSDAEGAMLLRGTDAEPCSLAGGNAPWSRFHRDGVVAGTGVVELRLKRADDPEPVGLSGCELHGRVVDAATGQPLAVAWGSVHSWWLAPDSPATATSLLVLAITPWPYQTMMAQAVPPPSSEFHIGVPNPGRYALLLRLPDRAVAVAGPFDLAPGQLLRDLELRAEVGATVEVEVRDAGGLPVEGAEVWLAAPCAEADAARAMRAEDLAVAARTGQRPPGGRGARTDSAGRATFGHLPSGVALCIEAAASNGRHGASAPLTLRNSEAMPRTAVVLR